MQNSKSNKLGFYVQFGHETNFSEICNEKWHHTHHYPALNLNYPALNNQLLTEKL